MQPVNTEDLIVVCDNRSGDYLANEKGARFDYHMSKNRFMLPLSETQANNSPTRAKYQHARLPVRTAAMLRSGTRWRIRASLERAEMLRASNRLSRQQSE